MVSQLHMDKEDKYSVRPKRNPGYQAIFVPHQQSWIGT